MTAQAQVLVLCPRRYNGHELWTLLKVLKDRGHTFEVVSTSVHIEDEITRRPNTVARKVYDVSSQELETFDALVIVSGAMDLTEHYWTDSHVQTLIKAARNAGKVLAAVCGGVPSLAGVVKDTPISFFPLVRSRRRLQEGGAIFANTGLTVASEQKIVTAEHSMASEMWATEICNLLEGKPQVYTFSPTSYKLGSWRRRMPPGVGESIEEARQTRRLSGN